MRSFGGKVLFLDRSNINTDEIIPAKYLTEISKEALGPHLLEDLTIDGFDPSGIEVRSAGVIVTRANFGCGSSREHAVWALEVNGINVVLAPSFARIFRQNMFNSGMLAVELPEHDIDALFSRREEDATIDIDLGTGSVRLSSRSGSLVIPFTLSEFDRVLVQSGGWIGFADERY